MSDTKISLSICIPTYNRATSLEETLLSVLDQIDPVVDEIIVSDNASKDHTFALIKKYQKDFTFIVYHRWPYPVEAGLNLMKSIELAQSDFCWFLTDDDILEKGAIQKVKKLLYTYPQISGISVNAKGYDKNLEKGKKIRFKHSINELTYFTDAKECLKHLGAWIGFWSAQIVRRTLWEEAVKDEKYKQFLGYHHLYLIAKIIKTHCHWCFLEEKYVGYRADNESFKHEYGFIKRYEIDATTYLQIYSELFDKSSTVTKSVCQMVIKYYLFWQLISLKCEGISLRNLYRLFCISWKSFSRYHLFWTRILPLLATPKFALRFLRKIYRRYV